MRVRNAIKVKKKHNITQWWRNPFLHDLRLYFRFYCFSLILAFTSTHRFRPLGFMICSMKRTLIASKLFSKFPYCTQIYADSPTHLARSYGWALKCGETHLSSSVEIKLNDIFIPYWLRLRWIVLIRLFDFTFTSSLQIVSCQFIWCILILRSSGGSICMGL